MAVRVLTQEQARRIAIRAQLLDDPRPSELHDVVRRLGRVQLEPTNAVAPSADVVLWSRLGDDYRPADLRDAVEEQTLIDHRGSAFAPDDVALMRLEMAEWPGPEPHTPWQRELAAWVRDNERCRRDVLDALRSDGPLPSSELPDTCERPWRSSGWNNARNLNRLLDQMVQRGEIAVAGRGGKGDRERTYDLADRVLPDPPPLTAAEARRRRTERWLETLGIARAARRDETHEPLDAEPVGVQVRVDDVRGTWRVAPDALELVDEPFTARTVLLSPLDRLVFDRKRLADLFDFDYQLEMYKPAAQRIWGYWAMPILVGDRLVGKLDATAVRDDGVLRVDAVHEDEPFDDATAAAVRAEIATLAAWLDLEPVGPRGP